MKSSRKLIGIISLISLWFSMFAPLVTVRAAIAATDYFQLTVAGNVTTMDSGASLVFTVNSKDAGGVANTLAGADYALIDIWPMGTGFGGSVAADITAIGGGVTLKASQANPWGDGTTAADIDGTNDTFAAINIDASGTGTFTVTATESIGICVGANGAAINHPDTGDNNDGGTVPGQDCREITVGAASSGADHLKADFGSETTAKVGDLRTVTVSQVNTGGGVVSSALADVVIDTASVSVAAGTNSGVLVNSDLTTNEFGIFGIVKFTSAVNTDAYYMTSAITNTTFTFMGGIANTVFSDSNILPVSGLAASGIQFAIDGGDTITKNVASVVNTSEETTLVAGDVVSLTGDNCYYASVVSTVNAGADSTVTIIGIGSNNDFATCTTGAGTINKLTATDGTAGAYTVAAQAAAGAHIYSVGGVTTGNGAITVVTDQTLNNGTLSAVIIPTSSGTLTVTPTSLTLPGSKVTDTLTVSEADVVTIQGYGPPNGQSGVPTNAPVDFMFNTNPDPTGTLFPLTNAVDSRLSLTAGGVAAMGEWVLFSDGWGGSTFYRAAFKPSAPLTESTLYTATILKEVAPAVLLPEGMTALTESAEFYSFTLTTGTGGGDFAFVENGGGAGGFGGGFTGTFGGEFPPMAHLSYPMPGSPSVPTNIACVTVGFDRPMQASTLTTTNIYIKKLVSSVESDPAGTPVVTPLQGNESVCISGYTFEANTDYRVVVTRSVTDDKGSQLAGMPESDGVSVSGFGFGFENMGPFREQFKTGAGAAAATVPSLLGLNINQYKSGDSITGVPTSKIIRASFNQPLNPSTVNSTNIKLNRGGNTPVAGNVFYDANSNSIEFVPTSILAASTSYAFTISTGVTSVSGTAVTALSNTFTTGVADTTEPQLVFADADNYGVHLQFNEELNETNAINRSFYTIKTCSQAEISADGTSCTDGGLVSTVSLLSGVTAHYERDKNAVWMDGLTMTAGDGFYVGVAAGVTDSTGNGVHAANNKSWTGFVMGADKFAGGQGMFNMDSIGMEDFDMKTMGMKPINANPLNTMAGVTTKYFINIPISTAIPSGGYIELTYPSGFTVTGAKRDAQSPMNGDFNGPSTGTVTFATTLPTITGLTDGAGAQANDGIGYITAARKIIIKLSAASQASDFLHIDLDGIVNSSEPKSFDTAGYSINIKTFDTSNSLLEAMTTMPFFISTAGTGSVSGQVKVGATGLNDVKVFLGSPMTGPMEVTTSADGAGTLVVGSNDGEYKFENLPAGQYFVFTEPLFTSGATEYYGNSMPEPLSVSGATTKNLTVTAATSTGKATQPITITFPSLDSVTSLGFNDSIDIFAFNPASRNPVIKTVSRVALGVSPYTVNLFLPTDGDWNIGIGPAMPKGPAGFGKTEMGGWMPPQNMKVTIAAADLGGAAKDGATFAMSVSDKAIAGKVLDNSGNAVANAEVYAYDPKTGKNANTTATVDGSFSLGVTNGSYKVGAFLPGLSNSQETSALVNSVGVYTNGSPTASSGSSGVNPFYLKVTVPDYTIQGRVATGGGSAIAGAAVWAHRTDVPSPALHAVTDSSGNYTLYVSTGTWKVEGDAPNYGYLGSKTLTVSTDSLSSQNFEVASDLNTIEGTVDIPGTADDSGTIVYAYGPNGSAEAKTDTDGNYTLNLPDGTYDIKSVIPGMGDLTPLEDVVVDGNEVGNNFIVAAPQTFTLTLSEAVTEDTTIGLFGTDGKGNEIIIPAGSTSGTVKVPEGTYYLDADLPGVNFEDVTVDGAEFNVPNAVSVTTDQINIDGTGDDITITLPTMYTITGQVTSEGSGVNDVYVSVFDETTNASFGATSANDAAGGGLDGEYSLKVQAGTYTLSADKAGYTTTPIELTVAATSSGNDFALAASSKTITGTVTVDATVVSGATVWATKSGGGVVSTETSTDGTYTLNVDPGVWVVNGIDEGYSEGTAITVDTTTSQTSKNFALTELTGGSVLQEPQTESITPGSGGTVLDSGTNVEVVAPPNAIGSSSDAGQLSIGETNEVIQTQSANPLGNGYEISATDSIGNPITTMSDDVAISIPLTLADMAAEGVDTPDEASSVLNAYWDEGTGGWASMSTEHIYYNSLGVVIPENTVATFDSLSDAGVATMELVSSVDHFTTFAPIVSTGATPPATPTGLAATAGDSKVTLTWTKNTEVDMSSYNIWEANITEGILTTLAQASCGNTTCSKIITGLTNGIAYAFQIASVDTPDGNTSAYSSAVNSTPAADAAPSSSSGGSLTTGGGGSNNDEASATTDNAETTDAAAGAAADAAADAAANNQESAQEAAYGQTPFVDISTHWSKNYVENLYLAHVISGSDLTHFNPEANVTRAELTKMVVNAFGYQLPVNITDALFSDVDVAAWYAPFISVAKQKGLVSGYSNNTFKPNSNINRAEAVKILITVLGADISSPGNLNFQDVKSGAWYYGFVAYATEHGIVNGYGDGTFGPGNFLTRAEAAKIISLVMDQK